MSPGITVHCQVDSGTRLNLVLGFGPVGWDLVLNISKLCLRLGMKISASLSGRSICPSKCTVTTNAQLDALPTLPVHTLANKAPP